jgi:hypothetical protein
MSKPKSFLPDKLPGDLLAAAQESNAAVVEQPAGVGAAGGLPVVPEMGDEPVGKVVGPADLVHSSRTLHTGLEVPRVEYAEGADPILVESLELLERVTAGGLLYPWAAQVYDQALSLISRIKGKVACQPQS